MKLKIIDGWQPKGPLSVSDGQLYHCPGDIIGSGFGAVPRVEGSKIEYVELLEMKCKCKNHFSGSMLWSILGGAFFGLPGAVIGSMAGGLDIEGEVLFCVEFEDGRSFTAIADEATYEMFEDAALENDNEWENDSEWENDNE